MTSHPTSESMVLEFIGNEIAGLNKLMRMLGVSRRDLEIYMLILTSGGLTANEISEILGIPLPKVYESLSLLASKRWVYRTADRPARYYSIPIRELWEDIKRSLFDMIKEVEEKIIPLLENMSKSPLPLFKVVLLGQDRIPLFAKRIIRRAREKVALAISFPELATKEIVEEINAASSTKSVQVIATKDVAKKLEKEGLESSVKFKIVDKLFGSGVIGDEILLVVRSGETLNALWSDHVYFIDLGWVYFNYVWKGT